MKNAFVYVVLWLMGVPVLGLIFLWFLGVGAH